jgi:hypothetical protein
LLVPGQQATIGADDYIQGAPELVVEVAASSAAIDGNERNSRDTNKCQGNTVE